VVVGVFVNGAFDATFWPAILNGLRAYECPNNLFQLAKSYFTHRSAYLTTNDYRIQREVGKICPLAPCCGPGL